MPNATIIRVFRSADRDAVVRLWHDAWHDGHGAVLEPHIVAERSLASFSDRLGPLEADSLVAERDGRIVGFAVVIDNEVDQLFVDAPSRGTGVASQLLAAAEAELCRRGVTAAVIQCSHGNSRAHRFYSRHGWTDTGARDLPLWTPDGRTETHPTHVFAKHLSSLD